MTLVHPAKYATSTMSSLISKSVSLNMLPTLITCRKSGVILQYYAKNKLLNFIEPLLVLGSDYSGTNKLIVLKPRQQSNVYKVPSPTHASRVFELNSLSCASMN